MYKILVADDEQKMREIISLFLRENGMEVVTAGSGAEALEQFGKNAVDLMVLDVMLGDMSGFDVCKKIREISNVPILFLSALGDDDYYMAGYLSGADDYIAKPFRASILVMKIKRILERAGQSNSKNETVAPLFLDHDAYKCMVNGQNVHLTKKEFEVLELLMKNKGRILTRDYLLEEVWKYEFCGEGRVVDNHIKNIRRKLGDVGKRIKTIISVGYKYEEEL